MFSIKNLILSYGSKKIIENLNWELSSYNIHGLVGLNGAGKTTLLNAIASYHTYKFGSITYNLKQLTRMQIAYLETDNFFYKKITGREYLKLLSIKNESFNIDKWNQIFELPLDRYAETYSTGMKKKLAFMGFIAIDKELLLLDEPFNGVDIESVQKFKNVILRLRTSKTIIITSHILESLTSICDTISYINNGKIEIQFSKSDDNYKDLETKIFSKIDNVSNKIITEIFNEKCT